jgi:hypothetical protein
MDYSKTIIYKIVCNDLNIKEVYIGSTINFRRRKNQHKNVCNSINDKDYNGYKYQFIRENGGWENWSMYEIEKYPCNDKNEAHTRERHWIETLNATLNKNIPTRTGKEYREDNKEVISKKVKKYYENDRDNKLEKAKEYYEDNKDKIVEYKKHHYEENKDKLKKKSKNYYETNKEAISEKAKVKFTCECGANIVICAKQQHFRTNKHMKYIESLTK